MLYPLRLQLQPYTCFFRNPLLCLHLTLHTPMMQWTVVVGGPCGAGKSSIGMMLASLLNAPFIEGDSYHPECNVKKMSAGIPLEDVDREPWLDRLHNDRICRGEGSEGESGIAVLSCSSLKRVYRDRLRGGDVTAPVFFILLTGEEDVLMERMKSRTAHFMPVSLLHSQLQILQAIQPDEAGMMLDVSHSSPEQLVQAALLAVTSWEAERKGTAH